MQHSLVVWSNREVVGAALWWSGIEGSTVIGSHSSLILKLNTIFFRTIFAKILAIVCVSEMVTEANMGSKNWGTEGKRGSVGGLLLVCTSP